MDLRVIPVSLLIRLGVAAAIASVLVRSRYFKSLLYNEDRSFTESIHLALFVAAPVALGVVVRLSVRNFIAADLAFESAILIGVIGGRGAGLLGGALVGFPALLNLEYAAIPFYMLSGYAAGTLRLFAGNKEEIWSFSPFIDLSLYRWLRRNVSKRRPDWQTSFLLLIIGLQFLRNEIGHEFEGRLFYLPTQTWLLRIGMYASTIACVAIPLKIWNNTRIERKLEEQERLLLHARLEALQSQINPHFLFNTLNSVASLVRFDPDMARVLIVKLANILRRILRKADSFVPLQEEVSFIDDYLDIEVVRFGRDKLRVIKELEPDTLEVMVPSMLLQPLVENSIKHGLSPKIEGGCITLRSRLNDAGLLLQVEDDGVGMTEASSGLPGSGIGMANVAERLRVLYGEAARMSVESRDGRGTCISINLPLLHSFEGQGTIAAQELRSSRP